MILIIDFGSQFTKLIARRVRDAGVFAIIVPCNLKPEDLITKASDSTIEGIILSGSHLSVYDEGAISISEEIFFLNKPILGICYGQQLIAKIVGGAVEKSPKREFGRAVIDIVKFDNLFDDIFSGLETESIHQTWMSHGDKVMSIPQEIILGAGGGKFFTSRVAIAQRGSQEVSEGVAAGAPKTLHSTILASTEDTKYAAFKITSLDLSFLVYGLQFHPEVYHSLIGGRVIANFLFKICKCSKAWNVISFKDSAIAKIKSVYGESEANIICGLSGGVDSAVAAAIVDQTIRGKLKCIFVDTGLLRKNEVMEVESAFKKSSGIELVTINASDEFFGALAGVTDPEEKRKIIGKKFIETFDRASKTLEKTVTNVEFLVQGTIYPDVIESSVNGIDGVSKTIKSHHNVGGLPKDVKFKIIEPLRDLFKDEVRILGKEIGLPSSVLNRHPFPGPGLAIRIIGDVTREKVELLQNVDAVFIQELKKHNLYDEIWQAFCVLLPVKTVGVMGDGRTYENVIAIRAVTSVDGMTADFYHFKMDFLANLSNKIINEVKGVNRVVYDITSKPPATIEWE